MAVNFQSLKFGQSYERPFLARLWGYQSFHAISKGVVTPADTKHIILFVTKDKQQALPHTTITLMEICFSGKAKKNTVQTKESLKQIKTKTKFICSTEIGITRHLFISGEYH